MEAAKATPRRRAGGDEQPAPNETAPERITHTTTPDPADESKPPRQAREEEPKYRTCRICFGTNAPGEEGGRLISPCLCRGTMRFVHVDCLNAWRNVGQGVKRFYECDQCRFRYNLKRTYWAGILGKAWVASLVTVGVFVVVAFLAGFVVKGLVLLWNHPAFALPSPRAEGEGGGLLNNPYPDDDDDEWQAVFDLRGIFADIHLFDTIHSFWRVDWTHFLSGILGVGLVGASQVFFTMLLHNPFGGNVRLARRRGGGGGGGEGGFGGILLAIVVLVGIGKTFRVIYQAVNAFTKRRLISLENAILEVGDEEVEEVEEAAQAGDDRPKDE
jgi:hypothetical protein